MHYVKCSKSMENLSTIFCNMDLCLPERQPCVCVFRAFASTLTLHMSRNVYMDIHVCVCVCVCLCVCVYHVYIYVYHVYVYI